MFCQLHNSCANQTLHIQLCNASISKIIRSNFTCFERNQKVQSRWLVFFCALSSRAFTITLKYLKFYTIYILGGYQIKVKISPGIWKEHLKNCESIVLYNFIKYPIKSITLMKPTYLPLAWAYCVCYHQRSRTYLLHSLWHKVYILFD